MGGNVGYETINYKSTTAVDDVKVTEKGIISEDSTQKFKGLKIFIILQAILISFVVAFGLFRRRGKLRRRHIHRPTPNLSSQTELNDLNLFKVDFMKSTNCEIPSYCHMFRLRWTGWRADLDKK
ncbi:hypothetical protein CsSME_00019798 [Camellia sinensis var. sinensis]